MNYKYRIGSYEYGPVTERFLKDKILSGDFSIETLVWRNDFSRWKKIKDVPELYKEPTKANLWKIIIQKIHRLTHRPSSTNGYIVIIPREKKLHSNKSLLLIFVFIVMLSGIIYTIYNSKYMITDGSLLNTSDSLRGDVVGEDSIGVDSIH